MPAITAPIQLSEHVHIVYAEFPHIDSGNVYLVTGQTPTLIDCGSPRTVDRLARNIELAGLALTDVDQVIATHADYDHVQGFHGLRARNPELKLLIHRADRAIVESQNSYRTASYLYNQPYVHLDPDHCVTLDDGDVVPADDTTLQVIHTPGHSEGSICLLGELDGQRVLFAGDTVGGAMKSLEGADLAVWADAVRTWTASLRRLAGLEFDLVLNGHEPVASLPISRARFDRQVRDFGKMLNPWHATHDPEPDPGDLTPATS